MVEKRSVFLLMVVIAVMFVSTLACSQSGRLISSAEATEMAQPTGIPTGQIQGGFQIGEIVYLTNRSFLVSLMDEPGGRRMIAGQERGAQVEILQAVPVDGKLWYFVKAPTGQGWVPEDNVTDQAP